MRLKNCVFFCNTGAPGAPTTDDDDASDLSMNINDVLGQADSGRRPTFPGTFPKSAVVLLSQWKNNNLGEFQKVKRTHWVRSLAMSYKKRLDCFTYIQARAQADMTSDEAAAVAIDCEKNATLDQWLAHQKAIDPNVATRAKRKIDVGPGNRPA